jgi:hypothetical protein
VLHPGIARALITVCAALCACAKPQPPAANQVSAVPDLSALGVLVLPVHPGAVPATPLTAPQELRLDGVSELDAEIAYWLRERGGGVRWILPEAIDRMLARTPALDINLRALDVAVFRRARVQRIGDPLFGDLKRLASVLDARFALVPVAAEFKAASNRVEVAFTLIDTTFGDVVWFGVLAGDTPADVAQRVAVLFLPARKEPGAERMRN